ncbi:MAG: histidinol dehydrogenase [Alphaproteobacteria bacterium]
MKRTSWVEADGAALKQIGSAAEALAEAEGLQAHGRSISIRLN